MSYHAIYNNVCQCQCLQTTKLVMYIYMCLPRSLKNPIQQLVDITNITCIVSVI